MNPTYRIKKQSDCNMFKKKGVIMSKKIQKKISRRSLLKSTTAMAGAAIGTGLITGFPAIHASDDGKKTDDIESSDIVLLGVSRTSKTPTSIYLANRGFKTINIPLVTNYEIPEKLKQGNLKTCVIGLYADPQRLSDIRRNRVAIMNDKKITNYTDMEAIKKEVDDSKLIFKKYNWPIIDVTRKSVEETAASILKILEIKKNLCKLYLHQKVR